MPRSRGKTQLQVGEVAQLVRTLLATDPDVMLTLDDALWCYAYEPACQQLRERLNREIGVSNKDGMIRWCLDHSREDAIDILDQAALHGGWLHYDSQPT